MLSWKCAALGIAVTLTSIAFTPGRALADGTHFVLELNTGLGESAYEDGGYGLAYGASFGFTWKIVNVPLRFALLGTVAGRNAAISGSYDGLDFASDRRDLDIYAAQRIGIPVWRMIRIYGEAGIGSRIRTETLKLSGDLGTLTSASNELLVVLAVGVQARVSEHFSIGFRGEMTPLSSDPDLAVAAAHLTPTYARMALLAQIGVHF